MTLAKLCTVGTHNCQVNEIEFSGSGYRLECCTLLFSVSCFEMVTVISWPCAMSVTAGTHFLWSHEAKFRGDIFPLSHHILAPLTGLMKSNLEMTYFMFRITLLPLSRAVTRLVPTWKADSIRTADSGARGCVPLALHN